MSSPVQLPFWAAVLFMLLSMLWLVQHLILPAIRWFLRRRGNALITEVNDKLALKIPTLKLTRREVLIDRLCYDDDVLDMVETMSFEKQVPREELMIDVHRYAREIVPAFNALLYFKFGYWLAQKILHSLYRVRLGYAEDHSLADLDDNTSVVFVMNHRSNLDYIIASYLAAERTALSYAVGEWARVWPLQQIIRMMGGYFVRRNSSNPMYRMVLQSYVRMAAKGGVPQAVFPEGRLSRDGTLGPPKLGLLGYITKRFNPTQDQDIIFIPVGINYDRVMEDRTLTLSASSKKSGKIITTLKFLQFGIKNLFQRVFGNRYRNGYACVNFGQPVSLKDWLSQNPQDNDSQLTDVSDLAHDLQKRIGDIIPILPVAVVATAVVNNPMPMKKAELEQHFLALLTQFETAGYKTYIPRSDKDYAFTVGLRMFTLRRMLVDSEGVVTLNAQDSKLIAYYANSISHLLQKPDGHPGRK